MLLFDQFGAYFSKALSASRDLPICESGEAPFFLFCAHELLLNF